MTQDSVQHRVNEAMRNARENGYLFEGWSATQIANDILDFDAALEGEEVGEVVLCVVDWLLRNGGHP